MMTRQEILGWLRVTEPERLESFWRAADQTRRRHVGEAVHLRGLVEISNHCVRQCAYCGLRAGHRTLTRYRMTAEEILEAARQAAALGYGTVVLQGGEDDGITAEWLAAVVRQIKSETALAVTLSLGERGLDELALWRAAGADRYLLRFETSDRELFARIHPPRGRRPSNRLALLGQLRALGFEVGSGIMVGIPGQSYASLAEDVALFGELDLDMIGIGPFIPHPGTPLADAPAGEVPNTELMVYKVLALTRLVRPDANIPATTALATINAREGRALGLQRGANVIMPNLTPARYRSLYEIYPAKNAEADHQQLPRRIAALGRTVAAGPGGRRAAMEAMP